MSRGAKFKGTFKTVNSGTTGKREERQEREREREKGFRGLIEGAVSRLNLALSPESIFIVVIFPLFSLPLCPVAFGFPLTARASFSYRPSSLFRQFAQQKRSFDPAIGELVPGLRHGSGIF